MHEGRGGAIVNMIANMWGGMALMGHSGAARAGMMKLHEDGCAEWASSVYASTPWLQGPLRRPGRITTTQTSLGPPSSHR